MAIEITERHAIVQGIPLVQVSDRYFWFSWPKLLLYLIHLTLFQVTSASLLKSLCFMACLCLNFSVLETSPNLSKKFEYKYSFVKVYANTCHNANQKFSNQLALYIFLCVQNAIEITYFLWISVMRRPPFYIFPLYAVKYSV